MSNIALITGASSGIGVEFAKIHAAKGGDVILVARRENLLNELKLELEQTYKVKAYVLACDLSKSEAADELFSKTEELGLEVDVLINNAGFGGYGYFHERDLALEQKMVQVNITSLMNLTHLYLKGMVKRNKGSILNVASTAGFLPGPMMAVYFATKSFVLSFSEAIDQELSDTKVNVTALCPGPVATEFFKAGNIEGLDVFQMTKSAKSVAACGYKAMEMKKQVVINDILLSFVLNFVIPLFPRKIVNVISKIVMKRPA